MSVAHPTYRLSRPGTWALVLAATLVLAAAPAKLAARAVVVPKPVVRPLSPPPEPEAPAEEEPASDDEAQLTGRVRISTQYLDRTDRRLAADAAGAVATVERNDEGLFAAYSAALSEDPGRQLDALARRRPPVGPLRPRTRQ
ncbi:MAG: hypothetical protein HY814_01190 [Candidatus Riflebacteria bacterium]|nr:hypothetical protein [Candidatus Riflebacteria bacterium]